MKLVLLVLCFGVACFGQLGPFFETKTVVVKLDMPAASAGVDIWPQRSPSLDLKSYQSRMKNFGAALKSGDSVMVTKVLVKAKVIEFQLGGGGYGTFWDDTDTSAPVVFSDKSSREKDLENRIRSESDQQRRKQMQRELDDLRAQRERRDARDRAAAQQSAELKKERIDSKRLQGGSRFNIRYEPAVPESAMTPEGVMAALAQYVTFSDAPAAGPSSGAVAPAAPASSASGGLQKGMTQAQVEAKLGEPDEMNQKNQDGLKITNCTYKTSDSIVQAEFVNGVLVRFSVSSK